MYRLLKSMNKVIVWGDCAYEALVKIYPQWTSKIHKKAKRNHPLTQQEKNRNKSRTKTRIKIEHTISRIKKYQCCSNRTRNMNPQKQSLYWNIVAGICNLRKLEEIGLIHLFRYS